MLREQMFCIDSFNMLEDPKSHHTKDKLTLEILQAVFGGAGSYPGEGGYIYLTRKYFQNVVPPFASVF